MTSIFLKAKHWQLFLLMVGIPVLFQIYVLVQIVSFEAAPPPPIDNEGFTQVLEEEFIQFDRFSVIMMAFAFLFFGWIWSLAVGLQKLLPSTIKMKVLRFKILFFIPFLYYLSLVLFLGGIFSGIAQNGFANIGAFVAIIIPLHLFSMFCIFYTLYFAAKTIKTVELQRKAELGDYIGEFFMLWFYFIGIWFIQPRINKLIIKKET